VSMPPMTRQRSPPGGSRGAQPHASGRRPADASARSRAPPQARAHPTPPPRRRVPRDTSATPPPVMTGGGAAPHSARNVRDGTAAAGSGVLAPRTGCVGGGRARPLRGRPQGEEVGAKAPCACGVRRGRMAHTRPSAAHASAFTRTAAEVGGSGAGPAAHPPTAWPQGDTPLPIGRGEDIPAGVVRVYPTSDIHIRMYGMSGGPDRIGPAHRHTGSRAPSHLTWPARADMVTAPRLRGDPPPPLGWDTALSGPVAAGEVSPRGEPSSQPRFGGKRRGVCMSSIPIPQVPNVSGVPDRIGPAHRHTGSRAPSHPAWPARTDIVGPAGIHIGRGSGFIGHRMSYLMGVLVPI